MKTFYDQWTNGKKELPKDNQKIWVIDDGGFEYPAVYFEATNTFSSARKSITLNFTPNFWRPRT